MERDITIRETVRVWNQNNKICSELNCTTLDRHINSPILARYPLPASNVEHLLCNRASRITLAGAPPGERDLKGPTMQHPESRAPPSLICDHVPWPNPLTGALDVSHKNTLLNVYAGHLPGIVPPITAASEPCREVELAPGTCSMVKASSKHHHPGCLSVSGYQNHRRH